MLLWTLQHRDAWDLLQRRGVLRGDLRRVWHWYRPSYRWLIETLSYDRTPIWAWHTRRGKRGRPDLRESGHFGAGTPGVRIEIEVPDELVTLSRFDSWCYGPMNGWYLSEDMEDPKRITAAGKRKSWLNIFDLNFGDPDIWGPPERRTIQATLPLLRLEWVKDHTYFIAR
jgi:hypothetical protein